MKKPSFKSTLTDWRPKVVKHKKVKYKGKFISGGFPMGILPGTGGLPEGGVSDGGAVVGEAIEDETKDIDTADVEELGGLDDEFPEEKDIELDSADEDTDESEDPNRQGVIRAVAGAHLVYKRVGGDGKFEELWIYNVDPHNIKHETKIRDDILLGTDIPIGDSESPDGEQTYELVTMGNAQLLFIRGLVQ